MIQTAYDLSNQTQVSAQEIRADFLGDLLGRKPGLAAPTARV